MQRRILIVEDEPGLVLTLSDLLRSEGYKVASESDGILALDKVSTEIFDAVILDVMLPGKNGFDVCREARGRGVEVPILMLTARGQLADKVVGLKLGADDYLTKPFEGMELLARLEAILRRIPASAPDGLERFAFGTIRIDFRRAEVIRNGTPVAMSAREFRLLRHLIVNRGVIVSREELLNDVWSYDVTPITRTVDVHVATLRQKLEDNPRVPEHILTVRGLGYKFTP